jgi:hypothetical protein
LLENRGTKVDAHAHIIAFGYLSLLLALLQPYVKLATRWRKRLAVCFLLGAWILPIAVFLIHYVGLAYSPLSTIGWASLVADAGGLLVIVACAGELAGIVRWLRSGTADSSVLLRDRSWPARTLLAGGTVLVLAGFLHGLVYAYTDLYRHEIGERAILGRMLTSASTGHMEASEKTLADYGALKAEKAVHIAAHAHVIEFGVLALLLSFVQPLVLLREQWRRRWAVVLLVGGAILPLFVLLELRWGLIAGGIADFGGMLVVIALSAMLYGIVRHTGWLDWRQETP